MSRSSPWPRSSFIRGACSPCWALPVLLSEGRGEALFRLLVLPLPRCAVDRAAPCAGPSGDLGSEWAAQHRSWPCSPVPGLVTLGTPPLPKASGSSNKVETVEAHQAVCEHTPLARVDVVVLLVCLRNLISPGKEAEPGRSYLWALDPFLFGGVCVCKCDSKTHKLPWRPSAQL